MPSVFVTLVGGSPWGFRIQGGRGTGQPLRLSKVNPGSKAYHQGLKEGDYLRMVNGYLTEGLSQMDVQNIIKETGMSLVLEVERSSLDNFEPTYTAKKTLILNGSSKSGRHYENNISVSRGLDSPNNSSRLQNGNDTASLDHRFRSSSLPENQIGNGSSNGKTLKFASNTIVTDEPPPPGAVLLDKKITVDGDQVHTDKFYAIPVKEILKEKTSTTKFIPAPPKYEGIGPTEDGIPIGLRNSVKKENMHNWYKTMFKNLHKADSANDTQEYLIGYSSEPETSTREKMMRKKSSTLDNRQKQDGTNINLNKHQYPPSAKSSIEVYNVRPRLIEDYEPGYSSVTDDKIIPGSKRFLPTKNVLKPSYEFKNGYESDNTLSKKAVQPLPMSPNQQKFWYREVQQGGEIPPLGLGKIVPEKPKEMVIGPVPPPPLNYRVQQTYPQATRPLTLPATYMNQNGNGLCHQSNGNYEIQMRSAIHSELQQRMSPISSQLSPPNRQAGKSPSKSPDLKLPARALFDFKAETNKEIPLKKGDVLLVLRQLDKNWYEGEHLGVTGIFPISYVEIIPPEHAVSPTKSISEGLGRALYDFSAQTSVELSVRKGETLALLRRVDNNWFEARLNNKKGIIPASYIQVLQQPEKSFESPTLSPTSGLSSPIGKTYSPARITAELDRLSKHSSNSVSPHSASPVNRNERERLLNHNIRSSNLIEPVMYRAMYSYNPQNSDELELQEGDMVCVVEVCDDGWYVGTSARTGVFGIFPGNYVEKA
ncbi:sorbin and SH3 domain-containing protein 2-like isoform X2 [Uloborus diversus]|uniref:sorbin and SH3 domain-containing protein 2-like isoform X2 n=1 Tax=Uloborus diversus TaxID=327109 RepID=UPI002409D866|nr:sorbin and SH3 domain-containing protein 2-like isoform X2 [Uloborus diversus]